MKVKFATKQGKYLGCPMKKGTDWKFEREGGLKYNHCHWLWKVNWVRWVAKVQFQANFETQKLTDPLSLLSWGRDY